jgi:LPXTG-motif cell wall-anchored protein
VRPQKNICRARSTPRFKVITNAPAYELPSTGGTGTIMHTAGGLLLTISSALLLLYNHSSAEGGFHIFLIRLV